MQKNLVRDWMAPNPITIDSKTTVPSAHKLMKEYSIRRLPVVERERLVGIVTLGDLRGAEPSDVNLLSKYELKDLQAKQTVEEIMTWEPIAANPDMTLQQAARLMMTHRIAGLPVVQDDKLVGIITESDIFRAMVDQLPYEEGEQAPGLATAGGR
jgi:acetoin utilization protein AcuB